MDIDLRDKLNTIMIWTYFILFYSCSNALKHKMEDYSHEPERRPDLVVNAAKPFNAEPPPMILCNQYHTPNDYFYVRNHAPVPLIDIKKYRLEVVGLVQNTLKMDLANLKKKFTPITITAALMCAGNRRNELKAIKPINGVGWSQAAISNAEWRGIKVKDVLEVAGVDFDNQSLHIWFDGADKPKEEASYQTSVSIDKIMDPAGDVILAFEMNGEELPPDHGYPLRVIVPGYIGARSVKWLTRITVSDRESDNFFQKKDYKIYMPQAGIMNVDDWYTKIPAVEEMNVQSAICVPKEGQKIATGTPFTIKGYAISGGGRKIVRVDVSVDGGETWRLASLMTSSLNQVDKHPKRQWGWTLWELYVPNLPTPCHIVSRAWDIATNTQPKFAQDIWNIRGVMNNAWYRVNVYSTCKL